MAFAKSTIKGPGSWSCSSSGPNSMLTVQLQSQTNPKDGLVVCPLQHDIVRIRAHHPGSPDVVTNLPSWIVVGPNGEMSREGRDRDDFSAFKQDNFDFVSSDGSVQISTKNVEINCILNEDAIRLVWRAKTIESEPVFLEDSPLAPYMYSYLPNETTALTAGPIRHTVKTKPTDVFLGTGESSGEINKAGRRIRLCCTDAMGYDAAKSDPLYKNFPFYITRDKATGISFGILYDQLCEGVLDFGNEISAFRGSYRYFESSSGLLDYYVILGPTVANVLEKLQFLTGKQIVPPRWALGYVASTMTYTDDPDAQSRLREFHKLLDKHQIPCSGFYLSSGYTLNDSGSRCVFTWNSSRIPDPVQMFQDFHVHGIRVIPNVKPWLLREHPDYNKLCKNDGFFTDPVPTSTDSVTQVGPFWKGGAGSFATGSYIDFTRAGGFEYWKQGLTESLLDKGADAAWNDNNEYELDSDASQCVIRGRKVPVGIAGRALQTLLMALASHEALLERNPNQRPLVVSRSGCPGVQRYAAQTWSGDNNTTWTALKYNISMCLSLGLSGWASSGCDVGGFAGEPVNPDLFLRWVQVGVFMPRFTIHSSSFKSQTNETGDDGYNLSGVNEPWMFPSILPHVRDAIQVRYRLLPLLSSLHLEAHMTCAPVNRPLVYQYDTLDCNDRTVTESFEFLLGQDVLIAPVVHESCTSMKVWLPGPSEAWCDLDTGVWYAGGQEVEVDTAYDRNFGIPVFLRSGGALLLSGSEFNGRQHVGVGKRVLVLGLLPQDQATRLGFDGVGNQVSYSWWEDDGCTQAYLTETGRFRVTVDAHADGDTVAFSKPLVEVGKAISLESIEVELPRGDTRSIIQLE